MGKGPVLPGEPHESKVAAIIRCYNEADIAGCFAHTRQCNLRTNTRPGTGCDCELGRLTAAIKAIMPKEEKEDVPAPGTVTSTLISAVKSAPPVAPAPEVKPPAAAPTHAKPAAVVNVVPPPDKPHDKPPHAKKK